MSAKIKICILLIILTIVTSSAGDCLQDVPYESQERFKNKGMCGAACLAMVYESYGKKSDVKEIFYDIAIPDKKGGGGFSGTSRSCLNAIKNGFRAISIRARQPAALLKLFSKDWDNSRPRIIFSQRPKGKSDSWHATVLIDASGDSVIVHDPLDKPNRRFGKEAFLYLWSGGENQKEYSLTAISNKDSAVDKCSICSRHIPDYIICPHCYKRVSLQPKIVLGCVYDNCPGRLWNDMLCPYCDKDFAATGKKR